MIRAEFDKWEQVGVLVDGTPIRRSPDPEFGCGVYEEETGHVISPVAYHVRKEIRAIYGSAVGDKK